MQLIILDRDGVINQDSDEYIKSPEEWIPIPGSLEAIGRMTCAGYHVVVATNQSGLARGMFDEDTLQRMHEKMRRLAAVYGGVIEGIYYCPHGPDDGCDCRKPRAGLLHQIAADYGRKLEGVPVVGDSLRDLQAAQSVGARPVLVRTGKGQRTLDKSGTDLKDVPVFDDLAAFADALVNAAEQASR